MPFRVKAVQKRALREPPPSIRNTAPRPARRRPAAGKRSVEPTFSAGKRSFLRSRFPHGYDLQKSVRTGFICPRPARAGSRSSRQCPSNVRPAEPYRRIAKRCADQQPVCLRLEAGMRICPRARPGVSEHPYRAPSAQPAGKPVHADRQKPARADIRRNDRW